MKKIYIFGRGEIASRLKEKLVKGYYHLTEDVIDAEVIFLANDANQNKYFVEYNTVSLTGKLLFDFSSYSKHRGENGVYALNRLLFEERMLDRNGIISLPACYASSVIIPLNYISQRYELAFTDLKVVSVGGKSTKGQAKQMESDALRLASIEGHQYHLNEIRNNLSTVPSNLNMSILVGGSTNGIISTIYIETESKIPAQFDRLNKDYNLKGCFFEECEKSQDGKVFSSECHTDCRFTISKLQNDNGLIIHSYVNNIDLPINIAMSWLKRLGMER